MDDFPNNEFKSIINIRKKINDLKDFFINYSFDNIDVKFSDNDIKYINNKNNIFSIHTADDLAIYLYINNNCNNLLGYKQDFFIGKCLYSLLHKEDVEKLSKTHDCVLCGKNMNTKFRILTNYKNNSGNVKYIQLDTYIKKVDNIIITYIKSMKKSNIKSMKKLSIDCSPLIHYKHKN